ncbi:hypothetical protein BCV69DRAFT_83781 [Microstroma glucosiphilum]|uniref:Uncharacterized protein n=1 Tax=Pseudomicrostroma glucosiphilum TaxID=1684307 RepID=A0A316TXY0_9BASI|nr:hypothetical protein BCV69DRAFT_83781 [Pseudomicrostroma glucosiphilum]PWN18057.1 hypothetical protein BCV69DRAFT_83781 [Pseudomicrostroma glucosiphilum]
MPPFGSSPDASIAEASSRSLQTSRTSEEQERRRKIRQARRQKKLQAKQRDRDQSISGRRTEDEPSASFIRQEPRDVRNETATTAHNVASRSEERQLQRKRARSQSRHRDRSASPYRPAVSGHGKGSTDRSRSRAETDESSASDSDDSREESRLAQGPKKRMKLEDDLEKTALLTFRLRSSSSQFERVLDSVPSLDTAQEHVRTKFHLGKSSAFRLSSESPLGGSVVLEDEEDFRAFKLRVLRSRAESTVITVDIIPAEQHPLAARLSASTSPSPAHNSMLPPYVKQSVAQAALKAPPMASTPKQKPSTKASTSTNATITRPTDRAATSQPSQALPPPILPVKRPAPPPAKSAPESEPYVPPSLRAKYTASSASTASGSPNIAPALLPNTATPGISPTPLQPEPTPSASTALAPASAHREPMPSVSAPLTMVDPTTVSKAEAAKLKKGPSASKKWVEGCIAAQAPCGICKAKTFHPCYICPDLIEGGLPYAEQQLENLKKLKRTKAWQKAAIKDLEAVIANAKALSDPNNNHSGGGKDDKAPPADVQVTAPAKAVAPVTSAASMVPENSTAISSGASAPAPTSSSPPPALNATYPEVNTAVNDEADEAVSSGETTAQAGMQQPVDEEQDELAATQEMEQRQSQLPGPAAAHVTPVVPVTDEAGAEPTAPSGPQTSDAVPMAEVPDRDDVSPTDAPDGEPPRSQKVAERQAQRQLKQRETKWNKIRKDCAAAQDKVRAYLARETRGETLHGAAKYHLTRNQNTLKQKTAELEELDSELSDFATKMNLQRPPRAPELDVMIPEPELRRSPRVSISQKSPVPTSSDGAEPSAAQQREGDVTEAQNERERLTAPPPVFTSKPRGRPKRLAVSSDTQGEDPPPPNTKGRKSLSDIAQTIDTSATKTASPTVGSHKARVGLRTPLSEHSEDDVETSPILRSVPIEQATEKIDEQPLPPPMITTSPRITRRRSQTLQPTVTETENDADDELESAAEGPRPTPRSPVKRGGQAGSPTSKTTANLTSANGEAIAKNGDAQLSQVSTAPPSSALTLPDPSQAPSRRITRQAAMRLPSSSSSGSETSDDSDDSDEEMQGGEAAAEDDAGEDQEAKSDSDEEEASEEDDAGGADQSESGEEDETEATQVVNGAANGSGAAQEADSSSSASSHTRSRSNSAASSINSAASKDDKALDDEEEDVASTSASSSTAMLSDREEEADPISTFSMKPASPARAPVEPVQAPRSSGIFSSFNFFQSNRNSQDVNGTKAAMTQPNGIGGRSVNGANHSASQPASGRRPKLSMPRLSELDASVLLRRRQQPNESAASSQASTPVVATRGQNLAAPVAANGDDDEGPDDADNDESGSESASSSSSDSSSDSDDGKTSSKKTLAQKKGNAGGAKNIVPASKRASAAVEAKKKRKGLADLF